MKKIFALVLALSMLLSVAFAETTLEKIQAKGEIVMATEATYPPYEYLDDDANFAGCDIWLANQIADELGVKLTIIDTTFDGIIPGVQNGQYDIGIAAFTRTDERAQVIDFSNLYEKSLQLLIVKKGNEDLYSTNEALAGKKVGAQLGTIQSQLVEAALPESELFENEYNGNLALEVVNDNIAGFVVDSAVGLSMVAQNDQLAVSNYVFDAEIATFGKAAVLQKGNEDLLAIVNEVIDRVTTDGTYQAAYDEAVAASAVTDEE